MKEILIDILKELDSFIDHENQARRDEELFDFPKTVIRILGQLALFVHPDPLLKKLSIVATIDLDAHVSADFPIAKELARLLEQHDLELDQDSDKIWLPPGTTFTSILSTPRVECKVIDPIYALTSKAIKAKAKNRILIRDALNVFGFTLEDMIVRYGGDVAYFRE